MPYANGATTMFTRSGVQRVCADLAGGARGTPVRLYAAQARLGGRRVSSVCWRSTATCLAARSGCHVAPWWSVQEAVNSAQILVRSACPDFPAGLGNQHDVLGRYLHDRPLANW
jgi:hypothetical protein